MIRLELFYFEASVLHFNRYATRKSPSLKGRYIQTFAYHSEKNTLSSLSQWYAG